MQACPISKTMTEKRSFIVPEEEQGSRLDAFVARMTEYGGRAAKRLAADGMVTVDGKTRPAHFKLPAGTDVSIRETPPSPPYAPLTLAAASKDYLALVKPAGCNTARIAGNFGPSLEQALAAQWETVTTMLSAEKLPATPIPEALVPFLGGAAGANAPVDAPLPVNPPSLLTRLDAATSGLVLAAASPFAGERFRQLETAGEVSKYYLAVAHGTMTVPFAVPNALDTDSRKKTRVLSEEAADKTRHTEIIPVGTAGECGVRDAPPGTTLVAVRIRRGARHQIRAHLAHAGFPLLGDLLYGDDDGGGSSLHLHHIRILFPEFSAFVPPLWLIPQ